MTMKIVFACVLGNLFFIWWLFRQRRCRVIATEAPLSLLITTAVFGAIGHSLNFLALWANDGKMPLLDWQSRRLSTVEFMPLVDLMALYGLSVGDCFLYIGRVLLGIAFFVLIRRWLIKKFHF